MESLSGRHLISTSYVTYPIRYPLIPIDIRRIGTQFRHFPCVFHSKKLDFQDFQGYAKPSRLLPATEVEECSGSSLENVITSFKVGRTESLYKVKLQTSSFYGSGLSDINAGILLCLIDENADSILQRIRASSVNDHPMQSENKVVSDGLHFQTGSIDDFTFAGPKLGKIAALWISPESGQWRLKGVSLTVICHCQPPSEENEKNGIQCIGFQYDFEVEDVLLGEGSDISMVELRARLVTEFSQDNFTILSNSLSQSNSIGSSSLSTEESMKEYADLKFSLLLYDSVFILAGSCITSFTAGENSALAFFMGGICGFLYLLLLQRSVDGLPAPESVYMKRTQNLDQFFGRFKGPVSGLVLAFTFSLIAVKFSSRDGDVAFTPNELMFGMVGFLACKVAVVLAAFKPMPVGLKENK